MSLRKNTLWNLAGNGLPLIAGAAAIPYLMQKLGIEKFGIVTIIWTLIGYLSLFDFGLGRAVTQLTANNIGTGKHEANSELLKTTVYLTLVFGLLGALFLAALSYPLAQYWLSISVLNKGDAFHALLLTALAVPITTVSAAFRGALEGHERFKDTNFVRLLFGTACFLFPVFAVMFFQANLLHVTISLILARIIALILLIKLLKRVYIDYTFSLKPSNLHRRELLSFGSWMTLSNIISPIMVNADRFFISGSLGAAVVAYYTVPFEIIVRLLIIPMAIGASLFPRLSSMFTADEQDAHCLVRKSVLVTAGILLFCYTILDIFYLPFVSHWIHAEFAKKSFTVAIILSIGALLNGISYVYYTAVQARNGSRVTGILHLVELIFYIPLLLILVAHFGIIGASIAWTLRIAIDCILLFLVYDKRRPFDL